MATANTATRSVAVGLLLAAVSAGSLIAFALFAGDADNPLGASVTAVQPDGTVPPFVLGTRFAANEPGKPSDPETSETEPEPASAPPVRDIVLGKRVRNGGRESGQSSDDRKRSGGGGKGLEKRKPSGNHPAPARAANSRERRDHSPNGHAYGHYKNGSQGSSGGSQGLARGHDKGNGSEPAPHANGNAKGKVKGNSKNK